MAEIIPSVNVQTFAGLQEKIKKIEPYVSWCHLDVTDGLFSKHPTWNNPSDLSRLDTKLNVEVHLMVAEPEKAIDAWLVRPVKSPMPEASADAMGSLTSNGVNLIKRIVVHCEAMNDPQLIIDKCRKAGVEVGFAINPETSWEAFEPWFGPVKSPMPEAPVDAKGRLTSNGVNKIDLVQILAVHPGPSGQDVDWPLILGKIRHIRERCPSCSIEVDGGVNPESAKKAVEAGASILVSGNYIFNSENISEAIKNLKNVSS